MNKKFVVISNKPLQNLTGLDCFVQPTSSAGTTHVQDVASFTASDEAGSPAPHCLSSAQVSVCFDSTERLNSVATISSPSATADVDSRPARSEAAVSSSRPEDGDESDNVSADEYSFQENDDDTVSAAGGRRLVRPPSMHLRYTGTKIPGRGFDGSVGKCAVYRDGIQRELSLQEAIDILANPDMNKLSTMPPVRPRGGSMYLYRCPDFETRHDLRADGYLWCQQGTKRMPKEDPVVKRFYMYIRTEEPIKNVSRRPKKTFTKYDVRFKKCEYELINAEEPLVLVHYIGDETVWKPFRHMYDTRPDEAFVGMAASFEGSSMITSQQNYQTASSATTGVSYGVVLSSQEEEQVRSYLKSYDRFEDSQGGPTATTSPASKRFRPSDVDLTSCNEPAEEVTVPVAVTSIDVQATSSTVTSTPGTARFDATGSFNGRPPAGAESSGNGDLGASTREKFHSIWPTYEICRTAKLHGFVRALSVVPQVVATAASKSLLNVANDLAQLCSMKKVDRFEFYYVSAGPVASGYYLSTLLFRHCLFDVEPVVPLAYLIHERRNTTDHRRLFELIKEKCPDIAGTECVFITDREYWNISSILSKAVQLYSWHYIEDDVVNWVEASGGTSEEANTYLNDVYSLMKCKDVEKFNRDLALKRSQWTPAFASFFDTCLKSDIIAKGGRWRSDGLKRGIYDPFCGVVIPSCNYLNDLVGDLIAWHQASLEQLLQCLYYFSEYYVREIERSMHNVGPFKLLPQFAHYSRPHRRLRNFAEIEIVEPREIVSHVQLSI